MEEYAAVTRKVSVVCMLCNLFLCLVKIAGGWIAGSKALFSDGLNSAFDVVSGIILLAGAALSARAPDREHPYGHERFESVATVVLSIVLFVTGIFVGHTAIEDLTGGAYKTAEMPGQLSILGALLSIVTKELLFWYTRAASERIDSLALRAAAWDHRADVISTAGALLGIMLTRYGLEGADLVASLFVCALIIRTAVKVFREAMTQMVDRSCDEETLRAIRRCILSVDGVLGIDALSARTFGNRLYLDLEICEDGEKSLSAAHRVAEEVHDAIETQFPVVKHIMIHVNPAQTIR